jgi:hypothetical protein
VAFLVAAYGVIIAALVGYVLRLWLMERGVRGQLGRAEQADSPRRSAHGRDNT